MNNKTQENQVIGRDAGLGERWSDKHSTERVRRIIGLHTVGEMRPLDEESSDEV